eukprot:g17758.t1
MDDARAVLLRRQREHTRAEDLRLRALRDDAIRQEIRARSSLDGAYAPASSSTPALHNGQHGAAAGREGIPVKVNGATINGRGESGAPAAHIYNYASPPRSISMEAAAARGSPTSASSQPVAVNLNGRLKHAHVQMNAEAGRGQPPHEMQAFNNVARAEAKAAHPAFAWPPAPDDGTGRRECSPYINQHPQFDQRFVLQHASSSPSSTNYTPSPSRGSAYSFKPATPSWSSFAKMKFEEDQPPHGPAQCGWYEMNGDAHKQEEEERLEREQQEQALFREHQQREETRRCRQLIGFQNLCVIVEQRTKAGTRDHRFFDGGSLDEMGAEAERYRARLVADSDRVFAEALAEIVAIEERERARARALEEKSARERAERERAEREQRLLAEKEQQARAERERLEKLEREQKAAADEEKARREREEEAEKQRRMEQAQQQQLQEVEQQQRQAEQGTLSVQQQQPQATAFSTQDPGPTTTATTPPTASNKKGLTDPLALAAAATQLEASLQEFNTSKEPDIRQRRVSLKKAINTKIGQVSHQAPTTKAARQALKELIEHARASH